MASYKTKVKALHKEIKEEIRSAQRRLAEAKANNARDAIEQIYKDSHETQKKLYSQIDNLITQSLRETADSLLVPYPSNEPGKPDMWMVDRISHNDVLTSLGRKTLEADIYEARKRTRESYGFWIQLFFTLMSFLIALGSLIVAILALSLKTS